ncbi:MAG: hypothetical protein ABI648_07915 [Betaproteobacteria bacterium]
MHEFTYGGTSDNPHYGAVPNPWDAERFLAGSRGKCKGERCSAIWYESGAACACIEHSLCHCGPRNEGGAADGADRRKF